MKRAIAVALALACAACGRSTSDDVAPDPSAPRTNAPLSRSSTSENEAPLIESAELTPNPAGAGDAITLELNSRDPERDRLTTTVEWYKNGVLQSDLRGTVIDPGTFSRGDRVYAIATVADQTHEITAQTQSLSIGNSPPRVRSVLVSPGKVTAADIVEAQTNAEDADGDSFELSYRWYRNGAEIPGATSSRLTPGAVHRGDQLAVEASASDGTEQGAWVKSPTVVVANADPVITSQPSYEMTGMGAYTYTLAVKDADGDAPLRFELVEGPSGMAVDETSGVVTWMVPQDASGNRSIKVAVSDPYGGRASQSWVLGVDWNAPPPPASPNENAASRGAAPATRGEGETRADDESRQGRTAKPAKKADAAKPSKQKAPAKAKPVDENEPDQDQGEPYEENEF